MSYCRWSSDAHQSDVYVFYSGDPEYTIMVAENRHVSSAPRPLEVPLQGGNVEAFMEANQQLAEWAASSELIPLGLPHDGDVFTYTSASETVEQLLLLRSMGYYVPQFAIEVLNQEDV